MLESSILSEFEEKDYNVFNQQLLGVELTESEFEETLSRILSSKSPSFQKKVNSIVLERKRELLECAFERAMKRYKARMTLRFMMFEQNEMGE